MPRIESPAVLFAAVVACAVLVAAPLPPWTKIVGGLPLVLYLPGRCLMAAVFPNRTVDGETRALSSALSLALVALLGLVLDQMHRLEPVDWAVSLVGLCGLGCIVFTLGSLSLARTHASLPNRVPLRAAHILALLGSVGLAGFAYHQAAGGALAQRQDLYTNLWIVPDDARLPGYAMAGVRNEEGRDATFSADVVARGDLVERIPTFSLHAGEERTFRIALPTVTYAPAPPAMSADAHPTESSTNAGVLSRRADGETARLRVELRLYKDGNRDTAYRRVWVALPPAVDTESPDVKSATPAGDLAVSGVAEPDLQSKQPNGLLSVPGSSLAAVGPVQPLRDGLRSADPSMSSTFRLPGADNRADDLRANATNVADSFRSTDVPPRPSSFGSPPSSKLE